ncbi:3-carboxy-cis,cis-muconate cycloisomerase [Marinovum sp. 2_MG-2023]|uniref:3-carboxy-cis,cis-muconate cycloisomerase n=1 Tax=unclassified Marinovum TaxID=2647166 RepID=UPI0026E4049D|nr:MULTISPECIES: 3-carboxy-cis,cis-muconate cycloisomerase [unclassified Marinovum]MDO6730905.1 3-carboxy-cis,cis-muconate cycloisomerase [Marinovum sp. 2_MG-2023]MDO6780132.1 3-carboxy-cis,cis-muconate cycloisomerase [Marinovum sp. 1_MG-2023]
MSTSVFDHPWLGGLFGDPEIAALWSPDQELRRMLAIEAAFSRALGAAGKVPMDMADRAAQAIETCQPDINSLRNATLRDGLPVPDLVRQLKSRVDADTQAAVHKGLTSQDVIDTAVVMALRDTNTLLVQRLQDVVQALDQLVAHHGTAPIMGRTRMQAALPLTLADRARSWADPLRQHGSRLAALRPMVERLQLGGAVGDRAALGAQGATISAFMADALGLEDAAAGWHSQRDTIVDHAGLLSLITGTLGKMGQDICLMAQQGIQELALSGGGGSSAMPHKQNPVLAELLVTLARFNATQIGGMHQAMIHEQERSGAAWGLEWMILPQMAAATARALAVGQQICEAIVIPPAR